MNTPSAQVQFATTVRRICDNVSSVIRGKDPAIRLAVTCLLSRGHLLIDDIPGVGKTTLAKALAASIGGTLGRVQFTPDLLPSDVLGSAIWNQRTAQFELRFGPVFANVVLADEVNRAAPKTQSSLLEAMAEEQVTLDGTTHRLPQPFLVIATQNPMEHHGTYPLPESQLDRFSMCLSLGYPDRSSEFQMLTANGGQQALDHLTPVTTPDEVAALTDWVSNVYLSPAMADYLLDLAQATRTHPAIALGMSPRALLGVQRAARVWAVSSGREFVTPDDVKALLGPMLRHRLVLRNDARSSGVHVDAVIDDVLAHVPVPTEELKRG